MESMSEPPPQDRIGLIDYYIRKWKSMGYDFDGITKIIFGCFPPYEDTHRTIAVVAIMNEQSQEKGYMFHEAVKMVHAVEQRFWIVKFNVIEYDRHCFPTSSISRVNFRAPIPRKAATARDNLKTVEAFILLGPSGTEHLIEWRFKDVPAAIAPRRFPTCDIAPNETPFPSIPSPISSYHLLSKPYVPRVESVQKNNQEESSDEDEESSDEDEESVDDDKYSESSREDAIIADIIKFSHKQDVYISRCTGGRRYKR